MTDSRGNAARATAARPTPAPRQALETLARRAGVAVSFVDQAGERRRATPEALLGVLRALGEPVNELADAPAALASRLATDVHGVWGTTIPAVVIAWDGRLDPLRVGPGETARSGRRAGRSGSGAHVELRLDSRTSRRALGTGPGRSPDDGAVPRSRDDDAPRRRDDGAARRRGDGAAPRSRDDGAAWRRGDGAGRHPGGGGADEPPQMSIVERNGELEVLSGGALPYGVHELQLDLDGICRVVRVIAAPRQAGAPPRYQRGGWGVFAPTYSLRDGRGRSAGDLTSLRRLGEAMAARGASIVATLPLLAELASADGAPPGQSPYAPLSRMWWNEAYLDLTRLPELDDAGRSAAARLAPSSRASRRSASGRLGDTTLRRGPELADLASIATAGRPVLERAAQRLEDAGGPARRDFRRYMREHPDVISYARFRAAIELHGPDRTRWPQAWQAGRIPPRAVPVQAELRHSYAQWAMDRQLAEDAGALQARNCGYLLDLPIGCRPDGYDPWAFPGAFATGATVGAPPDVFFPTGQQWGFPPPHPEGDREMGYPMLRSCLAHGLAHAAALRIDHVLGWSRLWWVPRGMPASAGAYVHYRLDELLAIACLESWRQGSRLIGEDLGTVEPALKRALRAHDVAGMRVAVFDLDAVPSKPLAPPASTVAYVDTHDTATFAGFLGGEEIDLRQSLGLLDPPAAGAARSRRAATRRAIEARLRQSGALPRGDGARTVSILAALLEELGRSDAELVIVNLEDLWGETDPHNVPGTTLEHANFARRLEPSIEDLSADADLLAVLERLDRARLERQARRADHDGADPGRADPGRADPGRADPGRADPGRNTNGQDASARAGSRHESSPTSRAVPTRERGRR